MNADFSWGDQPGTRVLVGYDGSLGANTALDVAASLISPAQAGIAHLWTVPFPDTAHAALRAAGTLFPGRDVVVAAVGSEDDAPDLDGAGLPDREVTRVRRTARTPARARGVAGELSSAARDHGAAVLVVGSRGRGPVREILLGSVAMATLHHAHRPVLVVPSPE